MDLSGLLFSRSSKLAGSMLAFTILLLLSGCWVTSVNALYDDGTFDSPHDDPDVIFDQSLVGTWIASGDKCTTLLTITDKNHIYDLQSAEQGEGCSEEKSHYQARLVKLDSHYFLDLTPTMHYVPTPARDLPREGRQICILAYTH
jgi:hypothetical protein